MEPQNTPQQPTPQPTAEPNIETQQVPLQQFTPTAAPGMQMNQPTAPQAPMQQSHDPGQGLGIASLVTSLLGLGLIGLILGIIGLNKSKKAGHTNVMAIVGIVLGAISGLIIIPILVGLTLNNFQGAQGKARDTIAITNVNILHAKLEEHYNEVNSYPKNISSNDFPGIEPEVLKDPTGSPIVVIDGTTITTTSGAVAKAKPTKSSYFQYIPFGCKADACEGYVLRTYIENPSAVYKNPYTKMGLQNP